MNKVVVVILLVAFAVFLIRKKSFDLGQNDVSFKDTKFEEKNVKRIAPIFFPLKIVT